MKKFLFLAATAFLAASCFHINPNFKLSMSGVNGINGEGPVETRELDFKDFNGIKIVGNADVDLLQGESWKVTLTTQKNVFDSLDYQVSDGILVIRIKGNRSVRAEEYDLTIQAPDWKSIQVEGAADVSSNAPIKTEGDLSIHISGAGDLDLQGGITCRTLDMQIDGAADVEAHGLDVEALKIEINGAGDVEVSGKAGEADMEVNGAGDIDAKQLSVSGEFRKRTSGIAKIRH